ncbi:MAG: ATP-binding cassette domain-containing protein [Chthoniobacter sp.]|nr:ATP-binding cassette domain-containing protein [Chthoniobacter sp.]
MDSGTGIQAHGLAVRVRAEGGWKTLLSGIQLDIAAGQFIAVIGPSGCGKSTLLKTLAGIQRPSEGEVFLAGHAVEPLRRQFPLAVGYLPQFGAFHPELTVEENLEIAVALRLPRTVSSEIKRNWVRHIVRVARIDALLSQRYQTLSGGQMRRMALAEELIGDPAFLFLDELTSGLDAYSDQEMMLWLRELAHGLSKTVVLVTHATYHLDLCDKIAFLHQGRLVSYGAYDTLLEEQGVASITELFALCQNAPETLAEISPAPSAEIPVPQPLKTAAPPSGFWQFPTVLLRQLKLFARDRGQLGLHAGLILIFPALVAVFATHGLPQVRNQTLALESNILRTLQDQVLFMKESFQAAALISGLAMFQVILLTLIGANNGSREIAKEREVLDKERRAGLSPIAYVTTKFAQIVVLCALQTFWMAWFVKTLCGFPGSLTAQAGILFATTLAMSTTCLAISAASPSPERASLLAIYLVGFQLPLSGAALALPDWLSTLCRPFITAYWGWSGYLQTFAATRHFDIVKQTKDTFIAGYNLSLCVLGLHAILSLAAAWYFVHRRRRA